MIEGWLFGFISTKFADFFLAKFKPDELIQEIDNAIIEWSNDLPPSAFLSTPEALFPNHLTNSELDERPAILELRKAFETAMMPTIELWHKALFEQWHYVKKTIESPQFFFTISEADASNYLNNLAQRLARVCDQHTPMFRSETLKLLRTLPETLREHSQVIQKILDQKKVEKTKQWRSLSKCIWAGRPMEQTHVQWFQDIVKALRIVFSEEYQDFVAVLSFKSVDIHGTAAWQYTLVCAKPAFCKSIEDKRRTFLEQLKQITSTSNAQEIESKKVALADCLSLEWREILGNWQWDAEVPIHDKHPIAIHVNYDPSLKKIEIREAIQKSTDIADYPNHLKRTSEVLTFLASCAYEASSNSLYLGNVAWWNNDYRIQKLVAYFLDTSKFDYSGIRVNAEDDEDWNFINTAYDKLAVEEFGQNR